MTTVDKICSWIALIMWGVCLWELRRARKVNSDVAHWLMDMASDYHGLTRAEWDALPAEQRQALLDSVAEDA
jgi:hypothetical protein